MMSLNTMIRTEARRVGMERYVQQSRTKEDENGELFSGAHLQRNNNMYREQYQRGVGQHVDGAHCTPEGDLLIPSVTSQFDTANIHTMLKQLLPAPKNRHGSSNPHWNAATNTDAIPQTAITTVNTMPNLRCRSAAVSIISSERMDTLAKARVAM